MLPPLLLLLKISMFKLHLSYMKVDVSYDILMESWERLILLITECFNVVKKIVEDYKCKVIKNLILEDESHQLKKIV